MAIDRVTQDILGYQTGDRSYKTGIKFWEKINKIPCSKYASDYWEPYTKFVPKDKHLQTKAETFTIEGWNSRLRHFVARFHRRTHCYSKSIEMVDNSLLLFTHKDMALTLYS